jgi:uroporphyrinogen decarboxylase
MTDAERARRELLAERQQQQVQPKPMTNRERFQRACRCQPVNRPPVWLMRQAGRALPEYRALKEKHSFLEMVQTPELALEVTLQPIRRFGFDAAILFSDILVIPEAMGQSYHFRDEGGVAMEFAVREKSDIDRLTEGKVRERLGYAERALRLLRTELGDKTALIGFAGSPWTLANFMMEGGSADNYTRAAALFREDRKTYSVLAEKLTRAVTAYLQMQIDCGVDAVQIFDSHGGRLAPEEFREASGRWMQDIISRLVPAKKRGTPVIVFSLGTHANWQDLMATRAQVIGIDWQFSMSEARKVIREGIALQGNLAPEVLSDATPAVVAQETRDILESMRGRAGHIFNLGHGLTPSAKLENISTLVETVRNFE